MSYPQDPHVFRSDVAGHEHIVVCSTRQTPNEAKIEAITAGFSAETFGTGRHQFQCPTFPGFHHFVFVKDVEGAAAPSRMGAATNRRKQWFASN